jgi:TATA-binding protein-associated factor
MYGSIIDILSLFSIQEYDIVNDGMKNPRERLARQKQNLRRRLGLDVCEQFLDVSDMIRDEDLIVQKVNSLGNGIDQRVYMSSSVHNIQQLVANMVPSVISKRPSARELNLLKRKAKINSKDQPKCWPEDGDTEASYAQNMTTPKGQCPDSLSCDKPFLEVNHDEDCLEHDGDARWPFHGFFEQLILDLFDPVWEVRHGSVMALREILTHQGASAGVSMSYLSWDGALFVELEDKGISNTMKREREIDLNMQVSSDGLQPNLKRPKFEDVSSSTMANIVSSTEVSNFDVCMKVDHGGNLPSGLDNGQLNVTSVKVEPESFLDGVRYSCEDAADNIEMKVYAEDQVSTGKADMLKNIPENCELMNLVKLARHSWLKNCEFLQECAIRLLCVLSLDRFGDYVSDQVVAPVRETCAQALGAVFKYMHPTLVHETLNILLKMQVNVI